MAQRQYRLNLNETVFPMLTEQQGRTVIASSREEVSSTNNRPTVSYCHNVMPSNRGLDSIGYTSEIPAVVTPPFDFVDARVIYGDAKSRIHIAWDEQGNVYALIPGATVWDALPATVPATGGAGFDKDDVTVGTVNGVTYILYSGIGAFVYDEINDELLNTPLTGLTISEVIAITASSGYLIAFTTENIAWSSTISPVDFTPSQITGAGGGSVNSLGGDIKYALANSLGILIYTDTNVVSGSFTGNKLYPFKFREVNNSKGGLSPDTIAYEANSASQYAFTKAGMQALTTQKAEVILPELTDFLAGKRFEDYDELTDTFTITDLTTTMLKKVKFIASRYLIISYGINSFTHAIVYDVGLEKLGKFKIEHVDCFEYVADQVEVSRENIAFLKADGEVQLVDFATPEASDGVLIFGKLQYSRSRMMTLQEVIAENIEAGSTVTVSDRAALDGKNTTTYAGYLAYTDDNIRKYNFHNTAVNHSIMFVGKFNLVSVLCVYTAGGRR